MDQPGSFRTIRDLAVHLGVSTMTVHRAIAGKPDISARTRARILEEIERLDWRPNIAARGLRQGKTFTLGILVSNVAASFLPEVLQGVDRTAEAHGYHTFVCVHEHDTDRAVKHLRVLQSKGVDGILLYPTYHGGEAAVAAEVSRTTPLVLMMRELEDAPLPAVLVGDREAGRLAAEHLRSLGHTRLAFLGYRESWFSEQRQRGFLERLGEEGIRLPPQSIATVAGQNEGTEAAVRLLRQAPPPTALFCGSDRLAARALHAARSLAIRVPEALSVLGSNGDAWTELLSPGLSTIAQPRTEVGILAARLALSGAADGKEVRHLVLRPYPILRSSISHAPGASPAGAYVTKEHETRDCGAVAS